MKLFPKKVKTIYAFADGISVPIEEVPDEVFSSKMMGDGIAIKPDRGEIYAPCNGTISMIMEHSLHALGIVSEDGVEVLLHIGIDSVELMGEGFQAHIKKGDIVKVGDPLISYDKELLVQKGINDISILIIVEPKDTKIVSTFPNQSMKKGISELLTYR